MTYVNYTHTHTRTYIHIYILVHTMTNVCTAALLPKKIVQKVIRFDLKEEPESTIFVAVTQYDFLKKLEKSELAFQVL